MLNASAATPAPSEAPHAPFVYHQWHWYRSAPLFLLLLTVPIVGYFWDSWRLAQPDSDTYTQIILSFFFAGLSLAWFGRATQYAHLAKTYVHHSRKAAREIKRSLFTSGSIILLAFFCLVWTLFLSTSAVQLQLKRNLVGM